LGVVPRLGGVVATILALAYFIGWRTAEGYYRAFGAAWVTSLLSPTELLQQSYLPLFGLVSGILIVSANTIGGSWSRIGMRRADRFTSIAAVVLFAVALAGERYLSPNVRVAVSGIVAIMFSFGVGLSIAEHAFALRAQNQQWRGPQLWFVYVLWTIVAVQLPMWYGEPSGRLAADPDGSRLPVVQLGTEEWRLVLARSDKLVVAKLSKAGPPTLRIVPVEQATSLRDAR
jgi:hypothetical protein